MRKEARPLALLAAVALWCGTAFVPKPEASRSINVLTPLSAGASTWLLAIQEASARRSYQDRFPNMADEEVKEIYDKAGDGSTYDGISAEQALATLGMIPNLLVLFLFAGGIGAFIRRGGGFARNEDN